MKLITILTLVTTCSANELGLQQFSQPPYPFPLHFQQPQSGAFVTDNNVYLPPDTHTAVPYFPLKNSNELPYQYLPATGTKAPSRYPPPFAMFSSTSRPDEDEEDEEDDEDDREVFVSSTMAPFDSRFNQSRNSPGPQVDIPNRPIPKTIPYYNPIERIDTKYPAQAGVSSPMTTPAPPFNYQTSVNRRMVQPAGFMGNQNQNDQMADQMKTGSHPGHHFLPPPQGYSNPTPEPVPILRLSNEMDLDGSYSYEALSGDQTHMMQHGHVENLGTDHAENVVEGSYSYVGDNGQTYTVHYIADGNGFRASGDHLPVAPPVPEIIQRSIEYNMAEESSKPLHLQNNYQEENKQTNQVRNHHYQPTLPPPSSPPPPPRNLFTGRQPEAFSQNHNAAISSQNNNLQQAASTQVPVISHYEAPKEPPPRMVNAPITPQITFLASQGAHDPSQSIKRMYTPPNIEGPVFRFGNLKNKFEQQNQDHQRSSWIYQNPFLHDSVTKIPPAKNYISRSSLEQDDDVMINFSEMSPEQYARMYNSQIYPKDDVYNDSVNENNEPNQKPDNMQFYNEGQNIHPMKLPTEVQNNIYQNQAYNQYYNDVQPTYFNYAQDLNSKAHDNTAKIEPHHPSAQGRAVEIGEQRSALITKDAFIPPSQTVLSSYDTYSDAHEPRQIEFNSNKTTMPQQVYSTTPTTINNHEENTIHFANSTFYEINKSNVPMVTSTEQNIEIQQIYQSSPLPNLTTSITHNIEHSSAFSENLPIPIIHHNNHETYSSHNDPEISKNVKVKSPSEDDFNDVLKTNIFLKNLVRKSNESPNSTFSTKEDNWKPSLVQSQPIITDERKEKKDNKVYTSKIKLNNEFGDTHTKPIDISQVSNLVTLKNFFESNKIKPKTKQGSYPGTLRSGNDNYLRNQFHDAHNKNYNDHKHSTLVNKDNTYKSEKITDSYNSNSYTTKKNEDVKRMLGVAKIYKTLQRNSKLDGNAPHQLRTELMPPVRDYNVLSLHKAQPGLPPLGRAGPNMKSYLPPIFS